MGCKRRKKTKAMALKRRKKNEERRKKKKAAPKPSPSLPEIFPNVPGDLTIEILSRVDCQKTMARLQFVSKACRSFIPEYAKSLPRGPESIFYMNPSPHVAKVTTNSDGNYSFTCEELKFPADFKYRPEELDYKIEGSCHGLVLVLATAKYSFLYDLLRIDPDVKNLVLVNPITREIMKIPPKILSRKSRRGYAFEGYALGYDTCTDDYKIISISQEFIHTFHVKTKIWTTASNPSPYEFLGSFYSWNYNVFVSGHIVFPTLGAGAYFFEDCLAAFNMSTKKVVTVPFPIDDRFHISDLHDIADVGGCFAIDYFDRSRYLYKIWIMKEFGVQDSWTAAFTISVPDVSPYPHCFFGDDEVVFGCGYDDEYVAYNWKTGDRKDVLVANPNDFNLRISTRFRESCVSPNNLKL